MKKLLGLAITLALVIPSGLANAELFKNLKGSGNLDLQGVSARNITDFNTGANDRLGTMMTRVVAGLGWDLLDDVHAKITLRKNDRAWGRAASNLQAGTNDQAIDAAGVLGATFVNEAYVKIDKLFGAVDTTIGHQFWGESGDLIAAWGPKNVYGLYVTALDAVAVNYANDLVNFQGVAGKAKGSAITTTAHAQGDDLDVTGIDIGINKLPVKANVFVWDRVTHASGAPGSNTGLNDNLWVYGLKLKAEGMGAWAKATVAANSGQNRNVVLGGANTSASYIGKALLVDLGYKADISGIGGITPWGNFGWGSGQHDLNSNKNEGFTSISSDYRPGVIYGRFNTAGAVNLGNAIAGYDKASIGNVNGLATPGLGNRIIWGAGLKATPAGLSKMTAGLSFWDFNYQYATNNSAAAASAAGNRHIGSEVDFQLDWAHSENVVLDAGYAWFKPGGFIKNQATNVSVNGTNPVAMLYTDIGVKF